MSAVRQIESPQRRFLHVGCGPKTRAHTTPDFATDLWLEAGFTSLVTMCIAARFELWAVAMKSPTSKAHIEALAAAHVPGANSFQVNRVAF